MNLIKKVSLILLFTSFSLKSNSDDIEKFMLSVLLSPILVAVEAGKNQDKLYNKDLREEDSYKKAFDNYIEKHKEFAILGYLSPILSIAPWTLPFTMPYLKNESRIPVFIASILAAPIAQAMERHRTKIINEAKIVANAVCEKEKQDNEQQE